MKKNAIILKESASTSTLMHSNAKILCDILPKSKSDVCTNSNLRLSRRALIFDSLPGNLINKFDRNKSIVKTSSTECEFFSFSNSDSSD
jgi:hypothetical protein